MSVPSARRRAFVLCAAAACFLSIVSCGPGPRRPEPNNLFWPLPPDPPRIHYIESIYTEDDIGRVYNLKERLFGKEYVDTLGRPYGIYARRSKILVSDIGHRAVLIFDLVSKRLSFVSVEGMVLPSAAVQASDGTIYVVDAGAGKIRKFDSDGAYRTSWKLEFAKPVGIAINESLGRLYIADRGAHKIVVSDLNGNQLFSFGGRGVEEGKFNIPLDVALDAQGRVYVLDSGNFRVQRFTPDGVFLSKFGSVGDRPGMFANPKGIAIDSDGHVYVTDAAFCNLQIFDAEGHLLLYFGGLGPRPGEFHLPAGISIDEHDRVYIADQLNRRIEIFQYLKSAPTATRP